jgi:Ca2+-binding RTX toxin-like protein
VPIAYPLSTFFQISDNLTKSVSYEITLMGTGFTYDATGLVGGVVNFAELEVTSDQRRWLPLLEVELRGINFDLAGLPSLTKTVSGLLNDLDAAVGLPTLPEAADWLESQMPAISAVVSVSGDKALNGHHHTDIMIGGPEVADMRGQGGDDILVGTGSKMFMYGGHGNDALIFAPLAPLLAAGAPVPTMMPEPGVPAVVMPPASKEAGEPVATEALVAVAEPVLPSAAMVGGTGNDFMLALGGRANMKGGADNDILLSAVGENSHLLGEKGDDFIGVMGGRQFVHGGAGEDTFLFVAGKGTPGGRINVMDFDADEDTLMMFSDYGGMTASDAFAFFMYNAQQKGSAVVFSWGDHIIRLRDTDLEDLTVDQFGDSTSLISDVEAAVGGFLSSLPLGSGDDIM